MHLKRLASLVLGSALFAGCVAHVTVPQAPPRHAPLVERGRFYSAWRPMVMSSTIHYQRDTGMVTGQSTDAVTLANGTVVAHPEDLIPLVDDPSPFADGARRASQLSTRGAISVLTGVGIVVAGAAVFGAAASRDGSLFSDDNRSLAMTGLGIAAGGTLVALIGGLIFGPSANQARRDAFLGLDAAMTEHMNLCGDDRELRDCQPTPTAAMLRAPAPSQAQPAAPTAVQPAVPSAVQPAAPPAQAPWAHKE